MIKTTLATYIANHLLNEPERSIGDDDDLLTGGLVDSMGIMSLVFFIEQEFGVAVAPGDVTIEHFGTLRAIERYLATHKS
jgi:acyl carrier protein